MHSAPCYEPRVRPSPKPPIPSLDTATLDQVVRLLVERLDAVVTYGAGGCPTCHDAELRGAIAIVRALMPTAR
jgi:carbamate kinase